MAESTAPASEVGFTLMELLVVLAIMGLLLALTPPLLSAARPGAEVKAAAQALAQALRALRGKAIASGGEADMVIDLAEGTYSTDGGAKPYKLSPRTAITFRGERDPVNEDLARLRFFPDGSSNGGEVILSVAKDNHTIRVSRLTGKVTVDD